MILPYFTSTSIFPLIITILFGPLYNSFLSVNCSNIFILINSHARSHFKAFEPYFLELANRGHNVTLLGRLNDFHHSSPNLKYININYPSFKSSNQQSPTRTLNDWIISKYEVFPIFLKRQQENGDTLNKYYYLISSLLLEKRYDAIILESFIDRIFSGIVISITKQQNYNPALIYLASTSIFAHTAANIGNPFNPSYISDPHNDISSTPTFTERLSNSVYTLLFIIWMNYLMESESEKIANTYFTNISPGSLKALERRAALFLVNSHPSIFQPLPMHPNMIEVCGIHLTNRTNKIPQDIEKFLNESEHGVIYFSFGSMLKASSMNPKMRDDFLHAFSKISQRVLWKWEDAILPNKPKNIMMRKWFPQQEILAHPNVRLFISHGGLLGTTEAVYEGVPIIGIPFYGDQFSNIRALERNGVAEMLLYDEISSKTILEKIQKIFNDPKYLKNAHELSVRFKDRPMPPLYTAIYWTEYVIRHNGAPHLRPEAIADMPWYSYFLLDVITFIVLTSIILLTFIYIVIKNIIRVLCYLLNRKSKEKKEKTT